jgi:hypothetical protein
MIVEPESARYALEHSAEGLRISIPARRNWFVLLFLVAWLGGWFFGEVNAASELLAPKEHSPSAFLAFWLVGWTLGGAFCAGTVLWQLAGREVLVVGGGVLQRRIELFGLAWSRGYRLAEIKALRATDYPSGSFTNQRAWFPPIGGNGYGAIAFDYGARTIRAGASLDDAEAKQIVRELSKSLPRSVDGSDFG